MATARVSAATSAASDTASILSEALSRGAFGPAGYAANWALGMLFIQMLATKKSEPCYGQSASQLIAAIGLHRGLHVGSA